MTERNESIVSHQGHEVDQPLDMDNVKQFATPEEAAEAGFNEEAAYAEKRLDRPEGYGITRLQQIAQGYEEVAVVPHEYPQHYNVYGRRAEAPVERPSGLRRLLGKVGLSR